MRTPPVQKTMFSLPGPVPVKRRSAHSLGCISGITGLFIFLCIGHLLYGNMHLLLNRRKYAHISKIVESVSLSQLPAGCSPGPGIAHTHSLQMGCLGEECLKDAVLWGPKTQTGTLLSPPCKKHDSKTHRRLLRLSSHKAHSPASLG